LRLGLIGCGWIVERGHLPAIDMASGKVSWFGQAGEAAADIKVVAVADVRLGRRGAWPRPSAWLRATLMTTTCACS
jgi:predicted dehydrogenase